MAKETAIRIFALEIKEFISSWIESLTGSYISKT
jgi:hypothetical protein